MKKRFGKKILSLLMVLCMSVGMAVSVSAEGEYQGPEQYTEGYYTYMVSEGKATITEVDITISGDVVIPDTLGGYPVISIDQVYDSPKVEGAFNGCENVTSVLIPESVVCIDKENFSYGCTQLAAINVSENNPVYSSTDGILFNKDKTTLIKCPQANQNTAYVMPESVTSIGEGAFRRCENLTDITMTDSVISIGTEAFMSCENLKNVIIPESVTTIGDCAFEYCDALTNVRIPASVVNFERCEFFRACESLVSIDVAEDNSVLSSEDGVLFNKDKTILYQYPSKKADTSYVIPSTVTSIQHSAFMECEQLQNVVIPDGVTRIGQYTFYGCKNLTDITMPDSITNIDDSAFENCISLKTLPFLKGVTNLGYSVFRGCTGLTEVTLSKKLEIICDGVFDGCDNITNIYVLEGFDAPKYSYAFYRMFRYCKGLKNIYYFGTEQQFREIGRDGFIDATIHYNYIPISVMLNEAEISFDQPPIIENDRTLVPLRAIFEALGATVDWNGDTQTVTSEKEGTTISLQIGSNKMYVNNSEKILDVAAKVINNRTLVPVRAISEAFGCNVEWDGETKTVIIKTE